MSQALATAEWADPEQFAQRNAYAPGKFWLGRSPLNGQPLGYGDDRHVCLVSGSRSGKGTTTIIPNLCLWPGSVVVVDPKGENATVTAARRGPGSAECQGMGQAVHVLDPFRTAQVDDALRSRFNPLDTLDPNDPRTIDEAGRIADAIVVVNPESKDPFWDQSARSLVKGLILHVLTDPTFEGRRNLVTVRQLIARGDHEGVALLREMGEENPVPAQALLWQGVSTNPAFNGVVAGIGDNMANLATNSAKQFESVLQVANRNTEFLDSPGMQECLAVSDFKLSDLKTDPRGVSVFLSLPQRYMGEHFRWLRMMITLTINEMEATPGQPATGHRVLVCLDEFAGLKRMEVIENAVAQSAGFGVKLFFVLQSLEQLKATYKDNWETFLSNAGLKLFFGLDDHFSRKYVSEFIGDTELIRELATASESFSNQTTHNTGTSSSKSWNTQQNTGTAFSDNWKAMPFFLRNTAGFFAAISGKRQATRNSSTGTATSDGGSDTTQESSASMEGTTRGTGTNQSLHKRPLITPDEVGRYFGRLDDTSDPVYPGLGLTVLTGANPSPILRANYFDDTTFDRAFTSHPDHPKADPVAGRIARLQIPEPDSAASTNRESLEIVAEHRSNPPHCSYTKNQRVNAPIRVVWKVLLDSENYSDWMAGFGSYGPIGNTYTEGTPIERISHLDPQKSTPSFAALGHCEPFRRLEFHRGASRITINIQETSGGTNLEFTKDYWRRSSNIFSRIAAYFGKPAFQKFTQSEVERELSSLCGQIEYSYRKIKEGTYDR